jgi:hypothetical protein
MFAMQYTSGGTKPGEKPTAEHPGYVNLWVDGDTAEETVTNMKLKITATINMLQAALADV